MLPPECLEAVKSVVSGISFLTIKELKNLLAKTGVCPKDHLSNISCRMRSGSRRSGIRTAGACNAARWRPAGDRARRKEDDAIKHAQAAVSDPDSGVARRLRQQPARRHNRVIA